jgi:6-phosphogluconolactonase
MNITKFEQRELLEAVLVREILSALTQALAKQGRASLLFSGGTTPKALMNRLANMEFDWSVVHVGLVDDRMVATDNSASNMAMLKREFLDKISGLKPTTYPLVFYPEDDVDNMNAALTSARRLGKLDVVLLGMGTDGHFASLFPNDEASENGLKEGCGEALLYTVAPSAPQHRISFSWPQIKSAGQVFLHITGDEKLALLESRDSVTDILPIDTLLQSKEQDVEIYWAP